MSFWEQLTVNIASLFFGGVLGYGLSELQEYYSKSKEKREAAALIRLETEVNLLWVDDVQRSRVYFREEAFGEMRKKGFIAYLPRPLPYLIANAYDKMYAVNEMTSAAREGAEPEGLSEEAEELKRRFVQLNAVLDQNFPKIAVNFGPPRSTPQVP